MKITDTINVKSFKVKPIVAAIALVGVSAGSVDAQPIVSVGGSINASAAASVSSSFPSLNANKSMNFGYSGNMDVSFPHSTDAVGSVIADIGSDSTFSQSLPGLGAPQASAPEQPSGGGAASLVSDSTSEATATLAGGPSAPSGQVIASAANHTASQASATLNGAQSPEPETDSGSNTQEPDSGEDMATALDSLPETENDGAGLQASAVSEAASSVTGRVDSSSADVPSMDLYGAISGSAIGQASGYVSGLGDTPDLGVTGSAVTETAAEAQAHIDDARPEDPDSVADSGQETDSDDQATDTESVSDEVADSGETSPAEDAAEPQGSGVAASAENQSRADAFATLYR